MPPELKPPPTLAACRVLEYAFVDSLPFCGQGLRFVGDQEFGRVPCLALCQSATNKIHLFHCDDDWKTRFCEFHPSPEAAKASLEKSYPGLSGLWIPTNTSEAKAAEHLEEIWGPHRCVFCGKSPLDFENNTKFIEKNGRAICEHCARACYEILRGDDVESPHS